MSSGSVIIKQTGDIKMKAISNSGSFTDFLNSSYIYIDKTETIYKLLTMQKRFSFHVLADLANH